MPLEWGAEVRVDSWVALNGRRPQRMIDPDVDLARVPWRPGAAPWIVPLREPLRSREEVLAEPRGPSYPPR